MTVAGRAPGEAAVLAHGHLLRVTVVQPVVIVLWAAPCPHVPSVNQQVATVGGGLLEVRLDMRLAARCLAPEAHLLGRQSGTTPAQHALQHHGGLLHIQRVELLHYVGQLVVLLQAGFLAVCVVALRAPDHPTIFRPGLGDAHTAEVVLARQLHRLGKHMQTNGTDELLLQTVLPVVCHVGFFANFLPPPLPKAPKASSKCSFEDHKHGQELFGKCTDGNGRNSCSPLNEKYDGLLLSLNHGKVS